MNYPSRREQADYLYQKAKIKNNQYLKQIDMAQETVFLNGIRFFKPHDNAPSFVKGNGIINKAELVAWLTTQPDTIRFDIKESKEGKFYASVNTYEPKAGAAPVKKQNGYPDVDESEDSQLPF